MGYVELRVDADTALEGRHLAKPQGVEVESFAEAVDVADVADSITLHIASTVGCFTLALAAEIARPQPDH